MGKVKNLIAGWLAVLWSVVPWHAAINSEKVNTQRDTTNQEIVNVFAEKQDNSTIDRNQNPEKYTWIYAGFETNPESLDWQKIYNISLSEVPTEVLKYGMLRKMNEIRKTHWLKPLKYDKKLEEVAQDFANDREQNWPTNLSHIDSKWRYPDDRIEDAWLMYDYVEEIFKDGVVEWIWENLCTFSGYNINTVYDAWMNSPWHRRNIVSPYVTSIWYWFTKKWNTIVCLFANVVKK